MCEGNAEEKFQVLLWTSQLQYYRIYRYVYIFHIHYSNIVLYLCTYTYTLLTHNLILSFNDFLSRIMSLNLLYNFTKNTRTHYTTSTSLCSRIDPPCKKYVKDFLMSFWRQFGQKWYWIRWKSHNFLSKCHGNSITWTCVKSTSCFCMENK